MHRVIGERDPTSVAADLARTLLREMVRARLFDERAFALQRQGWMSGWPPYRGQEASQVGAAVALAEEDWLVPTYRSNAMQLARGVPMADILRFRRGHPEFGSDHDVLVLPEAVPIASQIPHATGLGMAANYCDTDEAVLCCFGDGATSEGDFHEGLNFAGVFETPVVFFCENNGWAISTPETIQTASDTIAQKAEAYGIESRRVDGNDALAVQETVRAALADAREGRPGLVESLTHRDGPHTTSDDPDRYRDRAAFPDWRTSDPLDRFVEYLRDGGVIDAEFVDSVRAEADETFEAARESADRAEPDPDDLFDHAYADVPSGLQRQRAALEDHVRRNGDPYRR
jgi:pyruvate dehydrogenase E1 component alpha subunit